MRLRRRSLSPLLLGLPALRPMRRLLRILRRGRLARQELLARDNGFVGVGKFYEKTEGWGASSSLLFVWPRKAR
jgi:hypothetical protein